MSTEESISNVSAPSNEIFAPTVTANRIRRDGVSFVPRIIAPSGQALAEFDSYWDDLPADEYVSDLGLARFRQYGRFEAIPLDKGGYEFTLLPPTGFRQSAELIPLYAGRTRIFPPPPASFWHSAVFQRLVESDLQVLEEVTGERKARLCGAHLIRVAVGLEASAHPTPEGRHRDGHEFIAVHLIHRKACSGGTSVVYGRDSSLVVSSVTMADQFDTLMLADNEVEHEVTPLHGLAASGMRDTLLIDFEYSAR